MSSGSEWKLLDREEIEVYYKDDEGEPDVYKRQSISGELNVNIFAEQLKEKIQILASEIYGNDTNLTPDILYEAYQMCIRDSIQAVSEF